MRRAILAAAMVAITVTACGGDDGDSASEASTAATGTTFPDTVGTESAAPKTTEPVDTTAPVMTEPTTTRASTTLPPTTPPPTTAPPPPLVFDGSGADVIDLGSTITEPKLVVATSQGSSNFFAYEMGEDLVEDDLLVNEIAPSSGSYVMNIGQSDEGTRYIKVQADDAWHFEIRSILEARPWDGLAPLVGAGSDVVRYTGDGGILDYANTGNSNFFVYAHGGTFPELIINDIGPITGTTTVPSGPSTLEITAVGDWTSRRGPD